MALNINSFSIVSLSIVNKGFGLLLNIIIIIMIIEFWPCLQFWRKINETIEILETFFTERVEEIKVLRNNIQNMVKQIAENINMEKKLVGRSAGLPYSASYGGGSTT